MPPDPSYNPYAQPLGRGWYVAFIGALLAMALLVAGALTAERWMPHDRVFKETLAAFVAPWQELFLASLPGEESAEYVIFLAGNHTPEDVAPYLAAEGFAEVEREGIFTGVMVVTLGTADRGALERLRGQPFVRMLVRNQGVFFCH